MHFRKPINSGIRFVTPEQAAGGVKQLSILRKKYHRVPHAFDDWQGLTWLHPERIHAPSDQIFLPDYPTLKWPDFFLPLMGRFSNPDKVKNYHDRLFVWANWFAIALNQRFDDALADIQAKLNRISENQRRATENRQTIKQLETKLNALGHAQHQVRDILQANGQRIKMMLDRYEAVPQKTVADIVSAFLGEPSGQK